MHRDAFVNSPITLLQLKIKSVLHEKAILVCWKCQFIFLRTNFVLLPFAYCKPLQTNSQTQNAPLLRTANKAIISRPTPIITPAHIYNTTSSPKHLNSTLIAQQNILLLLRQRLYLLLLVQLRRVAILLMRLGEIGQHSQILRDETILRLAVRLIYR